MTNQARQIYSGLQALRAVAASMVLVQHAFYLTSLATQNSSDWFFRLQFGSVGVFLFFVISGAVMALATTEQTPVTFALSRFFRIYPSFALAMLLAYLILSPTGDRPQVDWTDASLILLPSGSLNSSFGVPYWTLIFEVEFYALLWVVALCGIAHRIRIWLALLWASAILGAGASGVQIPLANPYAAQIVLSPLNLFFIFGYIAGSATMTKDWRPLMALTFGAAVSVEFLAAWPPQYLVLAAMIVSTVVAAISLNSEFLPRWAARLGDRSYGLYLLHFPAMLLACHWVGSAGWPFEAVLLTLILSGGVVGLLFGELDYRAYRHFWKVLVRRLSQVAPSSTGAHEQTRWGYGVIAATVRCTEPRNSIVLDGNIVAPGNEGDVLCVADSYPLSLCIGNAPVSGLAGGSIPYLAKADR